MSRERKHSGAVVYSVALHLAVVAALSVSVHLPNWQEAGLPAPIQATMVDSSVLEKREQDKREEQQRQQREEKQRRDAEQKAQRDREETARREQQLKDKQAIELKEKLAREQKAREDAAKREQEQKAKQAQELKEKQAREQKAKEDAAKAAIARKQQQQAEDDLQRQLAAEADRQQAERSGLLDQYIRMIQDKIERNWTRPLSASAGLDCMVSVVQLPTGDVIEARVTSCNGDDAVRRSIEAAVRLASPLPRPPNPNLFERNLNVRFRPEI